MAHHVLVLGNVLLREFYTCCRSFTLAKETGPAGLACVTAVGRDKDAGGLGLWADPRRHCGDDLD